MPETTDQHAESFFLHEAYSHQELNEIYNQLEPYTRVTPLLLSETLGQMIAGQVWVKPENLQITGAFKFRGALFRLMQLSEKERKQGVAAYSSGNFARGLAQAGKLLNIPVHLVMPFDAPVNKIESAKKLKAEVTLCHDTNPSREEAASRMAATIARKGHYILLHPFDDPLIIKGQASVAVELQRQLLVGQQPCDCLLCPSGGGSLVAGSSLIFSPKTTATQVYAVEVDGYDGMGRSLTQGKRARAPGNAPSQCDALLAPAPGIATFTVAQETSVKGLSVDESFIQEAMILAFEELKLVLEPSGAITIAAILQHPDLFHKKNVAIITSGGNIDRKDFSCFLRT